MKMDVSDKGDGAVYGSGVWNCSCGMALNDDGWGYCWETGWDWVWWYWLVLFWLLLVLDVEMESTEENWLAPSRKSIRTGSRSALVFSSYGRPRDGSSLLIWVVFSLSVGCAEVVGFMVSLALVLFRRLVIVGRSPDGGSSPATRRLCRLPSEKELMSADHGKRVAVYLTGVGSVSCLQVNQIER